MDRILLPMPGHNVQAYVDDKVVTSTKADGYIFDLEELFATIARHNLKLNPDKCVFAVQVGKFLSFLLTKGGIEANPDKCVILPTTRAWRNRFVALSLPRLCDCVICKITLRTFSRISKRDLQNTQTAPLGPHPANPDSFFFLRSSLPPRSSGISTSFPGFRLESSHHIHKPS